MKGRHVSTGTLGVSALLAVASCLIALNRPVPVTGSHSAARDTSVQRAGHPDGKVDDEDPAPLANQSADLEARVAALERWAESRAAEPGQASGAQSQAQTAPEPPGDEPGTLQQLKRHASYESRDAAWSLDMRQSLADIVARLDEVGLSGTQVKTTDCHTTVCVVEFTHASEAERSLLPALIAVPAAASVSLGPVAGDPLATVAVFSRYPNDGAMTVAEH